MYTAIGQPLAIVGRYSSFSEDRHGQRRRLQAYDLQTLYQT